MDDFYKDVVAVYGGDDLADAGYLDCDYSDIGDIHVHLTPTHKIERNLALFAGNGRPKAVLFTTGGFSPIHAGHVEILEKAKVAVELKGYDVVGGFLSPSHDAYVDTKDGGRAARHAGLRVNECASFVADSDWIAVDPWESRYCPRDINFTTVYERLSAYLRLKVNQKIEVFYVFGGDNAGFTKAFVRRGRAVCVNRPGWNHKFLQAKCDAAMVDNPRVLFVDDVTTDISSTEIRNREIQFKHKTNSNFTLFVRRDVEPGDSGLYRRFAAHLPKLLDHHLPFRVEPVDWSHQASVLKNLRVSEKMGLKTISLDPLIGGDYNLGVSRLFGLGDAQVEPIGHIARPGTPSLNRQASAIPGGDYMMIDDDICTGGSIRFAQSILPPDVKVKSACSLLHLERGGRVPSNYDVVDVRDFWFGEEKDGGLVVKTFDGPKRAPYIAPLVSLVSRASVPPEIEMELSLAIIEANRGFGVKLEDWWGQRVEVLLRANIGR